VAGTESTSGPADDVTTKLSVGVRGGCSGECGGVVSKMLPEAEDAAVVVKYVDPVTTCLKSPSPAVVGVSESI